MKKIDWLTVPDTVRYVQHRTGILPTSVTVSNWMRVGKKSYSGNKVRLRFVKKLGRLYTCEKWVDLFLEEVNN